MGLLKKYVLLCVMCLGAITLVTLNSCEKPPTVTLDPELTGDIVGTYTGNYVVNYSAKPEDNFFSQITLTVSRVNKKQVKIDTQGGDSFECSLSGTPSNLKLNSLTNPTGLYINASTLEGAYYQGRLYYKVTGTSNGGEFTAEFTVL